jgi:hypothetical protein
VDFVGGNLTFVYQLEGLTLVIGFQPEGDDVALDLALLDFGRAGGEAFHGAGQSAAADLKLELQRNGSALEIEFAFPGPGGVGSQKDAGHQQQNCGERDQVSHRS